jgi:hypothetical protein
MDLTTTTFALRAVRTSAIVRDGSQADLTSTGFGKHGAAIKPDVAKASWLALFLHQSLNTRHSLLQRWASVNQAKFARRNRNSD